MHEECDECVHGAECPAAKEEDGECHGKWVFKSKAEATAPPPVSPSNSSDGLCPALPPMGHPLQVLGARLADLLQDDDWNNMEPLLLAVWDETKRLTAMTDRAHDALSELLSGHINIADPAAAVAKRGLWGDGA